ncbi:hypothetical protein AQI88_20585 [Streptomyces cellostaticus]|uniref:DUF6879 domain-containing protein n=1 Tax=Streptomyces cellostaticus TaxID=67285 RepID=A0A101NK90_9ACTN|nr:DUF6879 family protein [Streptomyces cellostaticus]KUM94587.1 hypothetical protein AQI88_20585 [Streptomyces cellostaticus]GHI07395.1 hypothetical protein Scel_57160 [Streptomyces cellostaticus]
MPEAGPEPVYLDGNEWNAYFDEFKHSAFRLEVHQTYTLPDEAETFRSFLAGEPMPDGFNERWHQTIRSNTEAGRTMIRAKIVRRPITPYSRFLFGWGIAGNVAVGEDYRILDLTDQPNPGLPEQDFWMFDETTVVHLNYRPDGTQINRELIREPNIDKYLAWRDLALESAIPFHAYQM